MYQIKDLLITMDLSEMDEVMMEFASFVNKAVDLDKIYFLHVAKELDLPEELVAQYPDLIKPLDESIEEKIEGMLDEYFSEEEKSKIEILVKEGKPDKVILQLAKELDIEIVVLGLKTGLEGAGLVSNKVARLAPCTVVFVPEVLPNLSRIVVPIDFSANSKLALEFAAFMAKKHDNARIICQNVYTVPSGYSRLGKSYEEFAEIMKENAEKMFENFKRTLDIGNVEVTCEFTLGKPNKISEQIYNFAVRRKAGAIAVGSKGRTAAASILLGSTAEKLLNYNRQLPLILVKEKTKNMGFLDALFKL
ncbi:universal stress protein [Flexithrix dorotheae]|uniref:universal stress protein n=1 Tax=Flexithrix dorotheae TaxID=70993 RepID=UPI0003729CAF|nr:universal stress protein [Flexithrix dorotheae]